MPKLNILFLESYFGGSHKKAALDFKKIALENGFGFELMTQKPRHWRWRFSFSHLDFIQRIEQPNNFDYIFCTSLTDTSALRAMLSQKGYSGKVATYFHENQLGYPKGEDLAKKNDYFAAIHLNQILSSDLLFFNSKFHRDSLFEELSHHVRLIPDTLASDLLGESLAKSFVVGVGVDQDINTFERVDRDIDLLWNHRWEEDKNPAGYVNLALKLIKEKPNLKIALLGDNFSGRNNHLFSKVPTKNIVSFGKVKRDEYLHLLGRSRLLPVTSYHDFFGISVVEAINAGVIPLLPHRLSYPELIPKVFHHELLYTGDPFEKALSLLESSMRDRRLFDHLSRFNPESVYKNILNLCQEHL